MIMRYIPHTSKDVEEMLSTIGVSAVDNLFDVIPADKKLKKPLNLPNSISESVLG